MLQSKPLVSVITIVYNDVSTIKSTLVSVIGQTYDSVEYIVIDGGSEDGTVEVIESYSKDIDVFLSEPDKGISDAFNKGIRLANGKLVALLNSGDVFCGIDTVSDVVRAYIEHGDGVYHGDLQYVDSNAQNSVVRPRMGLIEKYMTLNHPGMFISKNMYDSVGLYNEQYKIAMDYEWIRRAQMQSTAFHYLPFSLVIMNAGGMSDQNWLKGYREVMSVRADNGTGVIKNGYLFVLSIVKRISVDFLSRVGMGNIVNMYRMISRRER